MLALALAACATTPTSGTWDANEPPHIEAVAAGCVRGAEPGLDRWFFDAATRDPDDVHDVVAVLAHVRDGDTLAQAFELEPNGAPTLWTAEPWAIDTVLDCDVDTYLVDFVAWDRAGAHDTHTAPLAAR